MTADTPLQVTAAVLTQGQRLLAARRRPHGPRGGLWELPGGKVEPGESHAQCLARELSEELGIRVAVGPLCASVEHRYPDLWLALHAYHCCWLSGQLQALAHDELRWVDKEQALSLSWSAADRPIVERVVTQLGE